MNYPTAKRIEKTLEWLSHVGDAHELAKKVRGLMDGSIDPCTIEATHKWYIDCDGRPTTKDLKLHAINEVLECYGVEYIEEGKLRISYCNTGDSYTSTICYNWNTQRFFIGSWGDLVEKN